MAQAKQYNNNKAFSLAEVLITLAIMGIIAVLIVPSMLMKHQRTVYINSYKKITASLSEAITKSIADDGKDAENWMDARDNEKKLRYCEADGSNCQFSNFLEHNLSVKKVDETTGDVYLSDGTMIRDVAKLNNGCGAIGATTTPCLILVDTNGQMGPNELTTCTVNNNNNACTQGSLEVHDQFYVILAGGDVIPLDVEDVLNITNSTTAITAIDVAKVTNSAKAHVAIEIENKYIYATREALRK